MTSSSIDTDELLSGIEPLISSLTSSPEKSRDSSPLKLNHLEKGSPSPILDSRRSWSQKSDYVGTGGRSPSFEMHDTMKSGTSSSSLSSKHRHSSPKDYPVSGIDNKYAKSLPSTPFCRDLASDITHRLMASLQESKELEDSRKAKSLTSLTTVGLSDDIGDTMSESSKERSPVSRQLFTQSHGVFLTSGSSLGLDPNEKTDVIEHSFQGKNFGKEDIRSPEKLKHAKKVLESDVSSDKTVSTVRHTPSPRIKSGLPPPRLSETKNSPQKPSDTSIKDSNQLEPAPKEFRPSSWREKYASCKSSTHRPRYMYGLSGSLPSLNNMGSAVLSSLGTDYKTSNQDNSTKMMDGLIKDYAAVSSSDIKDMENVRNHLSSMLKLGKESVPDRDNFDHTSDSVHDLMSASQIMDPSHHKEDSFDSVKTDVLITAMPYQDISPVRNIGYDSGLSLSSQLCNHSSSAAATVSSKVTDTTLYTENQLLRESVEREKYRRKHCEKQIQQLQSKLLESQQQLAVAVSTDRKKDIMIEQLDKTLARVVEGWKKHESEKSMFMEKLKEERESVEKTNNKQQTMLRKLETELAQAVEQLAKEQLRATKAESEKDRQISKQSKERAETLKILESERKRVEKLEVERTEAVKKNKRMEKEVDELQKMMEKDRIHWQAMEHELQGKLNRASKEHFNAMDEYKRKLEKETRCSQDAQRVLRSVQTELDSVKMELDTIRTDKENMKMEISLLEAKHEANRTKMESQHKVELEIKIADKVSEIHQKMSEKEAEIRESHRRQVQDINESHQMELEQQRTDAQLEFTKKDAKLKIMTQDYEDSLEENRRVIADLEKKAQKSELHRSELVASLQTLMQSHCNEALSLLGTGSQSVVRKPPYMSTNASILSSGRLSDISLLSEHTINDNNYQSTASPYSDDNIALSTIPEENGSTETRSERSSYSYQEPVQSYSRVSSADTLLQLSGIYSELMKDDNVSSNHQRPSNTRDLSTSFNKNSDKERNVAERDYTETDHHDTGKHQYVERNDCNEYNSSKYGLFGNSFSLPADETVYKRNEYFTGRDGFVGKPEEISERRYQEREPLREEPLYGKKNEYFTGHNGFVEKTEQLNAHVDLHGPQNDEDGSFYPLESQDATLLAADDRNESSDTQVQYGHEDKQNELQYYIRLLLDRSPGSPLLSIDQQSEGAEEPEIVSARSETSTGSCPIKRAVRENNQYQNDPPTRPNTASYGSVTVQPAQSTRSCGFHEPTHVAPGVPQRKPQYESNQAWQSPVKDVRGNEDSDKTEGILTPIQVSEISRLLGLHKNKENQKGTSNSQSGQDKNELPLAHELFNYLRELPQIKDESYLCRPNDQQQSVVSNKQQQSAVPKTRRNLGDQTSQKGRAQQQIPTRLSAKQMNQVASQRHGLVQPMNQVGSQRHGLVQPMSQVGSQQRGMVQPNVQLCPHGRGPVTKTIMVVKKDKKSMLGRGVKKSNKGAWK